MEGQKEKQRERERESERQTDREGGRQRPRDRDRWGWRRPGAPAPEDLCLGTSPPATAQLTGPQARERGAKRLFLLSMDPAMTLSWEALGWGPVKHSGSQAQAHF